LPANPSTGYGWTLDETASSAVIAAGGADIRQVTPGAGTLARQVLRIQATASGPARVRLAYGRSWRPEERPTRALTVRALGQDLRQMMAGLSMPAVDGTEIATAAAA